MPTPPAFWFDWSSLILFSAIINTSFALYFTVLHYRMAGQKLPLQWLFILIGCILVILAEQLLRNSSLILHFPQFLFAGSPILFLILPAILFYQYAILNKRIVYIYHFLLPIGILLLMIPTYLMPGPRKLEMFFDEQVADPFWIIAIYLMYCTYYSIRIFKANQLLRNRLKNESADDKIEQYTRANTILSSVSLLVFVFPLALITQYFPLKADVYVLIQKLLFIGFSASGHLVLFSLLINRDRMGHAAPENTPIREEIASPQVTDLDAQKQELLQAMATEKYYLQRDLTLNALAQAMGWSRTSLSYVINQGFGQNFYDFVNSFRIATAETMLRQGAHHKFSLDHIALECGFSNYTSFYRIFKRLRNQTPSAFLKSLNS